MGTRIMTEREGFKCVSSDRMPGRTIKAKCDRNAKRASCCGSKDRVLWGCKATASCYPVVDFVAAPEEYGDPR